MMFDRFYRQRLEADLERWLANGVVTPQAAAAIRGTLPPMGAGINIAVVMAIVGGLLIAAAFLAFIAANWNEIARPMRFAMLAGGMVVAYGLGAWLARADRAVLADLCTSVGSIIFGAGIALVGQMYHLGGDFAGGMLLWACGALVASVLTGSRGALAVALATACLWSTTRASEIPDVPHLAFVPFWILAAILAFAWNSRVAAHLVAVAALPWWFAAAFEPHINDFARLFVLVDGAALMFGAGLLLAAAPWQRTQSIGAVLATYGAFLLAFAAAMQTTILNDAVTSSTERAGQPVWAISCGVAGVIFAVGAAALTRRGGAAFAAAAIAIVLAVAAIWTPQMASGPWLIYILELCAMLCLVVSGMLDGNRPRVVAGWLGLAGVIAGITWAVRGSLLQRSVFLAAAGAVAALLATVLHRVLPRDHA
jgi:uncharacterized membrane protein